MRSRSIASRLRTRRQAARLLRTASPSRVPRRALTCVLLVNLLIWPGTHISLADLSAFAERARSAATAPFDDARQLLKNLFGPRPARQETATDRLNHVAHVVVNPPKHVLYQQQRMPFNSIATDYLNRTLQGIRFSYSSSDPAKLTVDEMGVATAHQPGLVWLTSTAGIISTRIPILILPGTRPTQSDPQWAADQAKLTPDGTVVSAGGGMASLLPGLLDKLSPTAEAQGSYWGDTGDVGYDELWSDPRNLVGSPSNRITEQTNIGAVLPEGSNFELAIPMLSSPGRGVPVSLSLYYNSRIWSRHGNAVTFNAVNAWPFVGFTMGFGRIVTYGADPNTKFMLVDPDGTRHYLGSGPSYQTNTYQTNDGTHVTYVGSATNGGTIYYNSGRSETVTNWGNRPLVTGISDTNGNSCSIGYTWQSAPNMNYCGNGNGTAPAVWRQAIGSIYDTRGCQYLFNYDACNNLTSITGPGQGGTSQNPVTITFVQFDYTAANISNSFSGLTVENVPSLQVPLLNHVYFPVSQTGYKFSYSAYGMIYNASKRRQMTVDQNGNITDGVESAHATFSYPLTASSLTDAPAFTQRAESPGSANPFVYTILPPNTAGPNTLTVQITPPDAASNPGYPVRYLTRSTDGTSPANGLLTGSGTANYGGTWFLAYEYAYANDPGGSPQLQSMLRHEDTGATTQLNFDYDSYGNVTNKREFGYPVSGVWDVRRRTHYAYVTDPSYLNAYLRNLVAEKDVYDAQLNTNDADDILIAKSTYQYDNYAVMGNMENYGGNYSGGNAPPGYNTGYNNQSLTVRGNQTGRTDYIDVVNGISETFNNKRDIFGSLVQEQVTCCNLNTYTFAATTYWTTPDQTIKGDPNGIHLTKLLTHDFNTQQTTDTTDPNNLQTAFAYDNTGRPTQISYASGASNTTTYNDVSMSTQGNINFTTGGSNASVSTSQTGDGWGRQAQSVNRYGGEINTTYDPLGRPITTTNPFAVGGSPSATTLVTYDALGRTTKVTLPDGNTTQTSYSGSTTTSTDQVGRKQQSQQDGLGRLISVIEQDSTGALALTTSYIYDLLDDLTQINQGGQIRSFKYDALGRKTFELLPEQTATINDGTGTMWSRSYTYTSFNKVATRKDARGVITTFGYDNINRLVTISYNTSSAPGVAATNNVTFTYDTSGTGTTQGLLLSVSMTGLLPTYQETFGYDSLERLSSRNGVGYQYNTGNELTQTTYPDGRVVAVTYSSGGLVSSVTEPSSGSAYVSTMSYNVAGQMTGITLGSGVTESYTYDSNRLQLTQQQATTSGNTTLVNLNYSYQAAAGQMGAGTTAGNAGQLMAINNSSTINGAAESAAYTYDLERRLLSATQTSNGQTANRRFDFDRWGNRLDEWDALSGGNQLQAITLAQTGGVTNNRIQSVTPAGGSPVSYTFDANGSLTNDGSHTYQYDAENRIASVDNGTTASYVYDYMNRRVKKTVGSAITSYTRDQGHVLAESGAGATDYVYATNLLIGTGPGNGLGGNGSFTYFLGDRLNTRLLTDRYGNYQGRQAHLPFGEDFSESGTQEKHRLTTYERDSEASIDYAFNRHYEFGLGRYMCADPISDGGFLWSGGTQCSGKSGQAARDPQSMNLYTYAGNEPIGSRDLTGLETETECHSFSLAVSDSIAHLLAGGFDFESGWGGDDLATLDVSVCMTFLRMSKSCPGTTDCSFYNAKCKKARKRNLLPAIAYYCEAAPFVCKNTLNTVYFNCVRLRLQLWDGCMTVGSDPLLFTNCEEAIHAAAFLTCIFC